MKAIICVIRLALMLPSMITQAVDHFSDKAYDVRIERNNGRVEVVDCVRFRSNRRFTMAGEPLTMVWAPQMYNPKQFLAVTAPGQRTMVPYHVGVHGVVQADKSLRGSGIDEFGSTFSFHGARNDDCEPRRYARDGELKVPAPSVVQFPPTWTWQGSFGIGGRLLSNRLQELLTAVPVPVIDPCWSPPGSNVPCEPVAGPMRDAANLVEQSWLTGRSFRLSLHASDGVAREDCWSFLNDRAIATNAGLRMAWAPEPYLDTSRSFHSVGGDHGKGTAYYGMMIRDDLLRVAGIEAGRGKSVVTFGFGHKVANCDAK